MRKARYNEKVYKKDSWVGVPYADWYFGQSKEILAYPSCSGVRKTLITEYSLLVLKKLPTNPWRDITRAGTGIDMQDFSQGEGRSQQPVQRSECVG